MVCIRIWLTVQWVLISSTLQLCYGTAMNERWGVGVGGVEGQGSSYDEFIERGEKIMNKWDRDINERRETKSRSLLGNNFANNKMKKVPHRSGAPDSVSMLNPVPSKGDPITILNASGVITENLTSSFYRDGVPSYVLTQLNATKPSSLVEVGGCWNQHLWVGWSWWNTRYVWRPFWAKYCSGRPINWQHPWWRDRFQVKFVGPFLSVKRSDCHCGWGQWLVLQCYSCYPRAQGPPGRKGDRGSQGATGPQGQEGERADEGFRGKIGPPGSAGKPGGKGATGDIGIVGAQGFPGAMGSEGTPNTVTGRQGDYGDDGELGFQGPPGAPGKGGQRGERGFKGPLGDAGVQGPQGMNGIPGAPGEPGPEGAKGLRGDRGELGRRGLQGPKGHRGKEAPSILGDPGYPGLHGPPGNQEKFNQRVVELGDKLKVVASVVEKTKAEIKAQEDLKTDLGKALKRVIGNTQVKKDKVNAMQEKYKKVD